MVEKNKQLGLWIDIEILNSDLKPIEKMILADVVSLSKYSYCKTNKSIAHAFNVSLRTVGYGFQNLIEKGILTSTVTTPYGNFKKNRVIKLVAGWRSKLV